MILYGADGLTRRDQAHRLLALAAAEHWGLSPLPAAERAEFGKPFFPDLPERQFNLSHSGPYALCALDSRPVGVDIQIIGPHRPRILQRVCSPAERDWLETQPDLWTAFAQLWALKESRAKYTGAGLTSPSPKSGSPYPPPGCWRWTGCAFASTPAPAGGPPSAGRVHRRI